jgi:SSS family solute:Na+ symporter
MGETSFTIYIGLLALAANIIVAVVVNAVAPGKAVARA